jgi:glutathione S-transferase
LWHSSSPPDEVDPYKKPQELLEVSPKGLVPGLKMKNNGKPRALNESTVVLDYIEEYAVFLFILPPF